MPSRIRVFSTVLGALLLAASLGTSTALAAPSIAGEFPLASTIEGNSQLTTGPDNNVWATLGGPVNDVAKITPAGKVEEFDLGINGAEGIAVQGKKIWVTASNTITSFETSAPEATKATTVINEINGTYPVVLGPDGRLWVATSGTTLALNPADPAEFDKFPKTGMAPRDIDVSGNNLLIADFAGSRILTLAATGTEKGKYTAELGNLGGGPQGVAAGPNGQFAFSQPSNDPKSVGVFSAPADLKTKELGKGADPFGVDFGPDGAYWFAYSKETEKGLLRLSTSGDLTELKGLKEGLPRQITEGPGNTLWVTMERPNETGFVAEVKGVEKTSTTKPPPPPAEPRTQLDKGPKGVVRTKAGRTAVSFRFSSPDAGAGFQCRLTKLAEHAKTPAFAACRSPKVLRLAAGSYRFEVRAVLGGEVDKTPVKRSFKVVRKRAHRRR